MSFLGTVVLVAELEKHKTCLRCKGRVEPLDLGLGRCAKEDCQMFQKYAVCPEHLSATLMFMTAPGLHTYGQTLLERLRFERYGVKTGERANTHNQHWLT